MAMNKTNMSNEIIAKMDALSDEDKKDQQKSMEAMCDAIITHFQNNAEIKNVKTTLDNSLNAVFTAGVPVPTDGGLALQTAWKLGTAGGISDDSTQNNSGSIE